MKTLTLSLKKKWFDMIASGEKTGGELISVGSSLVDFKKALEDDR